MKKYFYYIALMVIFTTKNYANDAFPLSYYIDEIRNETVIVAGNIEYSLQNEIGDGGYSLNIKEDNNSQIITLGNLRLLAVEPEGTSIVLFYSDGTGIGINEYNKKGVLVLKNTIDCGGIPISGFQVADTCNGKYLVICNEDLYFIEKSGNSFKHQSIAENVISAVFSDNGKDFAFVNITQSGLNLFSGNIFSKNPEVITKLNPYDKIRLRMYGDTVAVISGGEGMDNSSLIQAVTLRDGIISENWVEASYDMIETARTKNDIKLLYLSTRNNNYLICKSLLGSTGYFSIFLNENLLEPYDIFFTSKKIFILFRNGITEINTDGGRIIAEDLISFGKYFSDNVVIKERNNSLILSSQEVTLVLNSTANKFWRLTAFYRGIGRRIIPIIFIIILLLFLRYNLKQRSLLKIITEQAGRGVVIRLGKSGKLIGINTAGKNFLGINESVPKRKKFEYYCTAKELTKFRDFVGESMLVRESKKDKIDILIDDKSNEWVFSSIPVSNFWGHFRGMIISGVDITEELEKKRLNNWASLAHDMQTNLSTIRLNAEQINEPEDSDNYRRRSKIIHQVNILIQRVRDIVTVGRSDELNKEFYASDDICREVVSEFDSVMFPNVTLKLNVTNIKIYCDRPKMVRAIRNAIENAIRALKNKPGTVTLSNSSDNQNVYFKIKDTGVGMTDEIKSKMLTPYFTTGSKEGGFGIGTMIMQRVIEMHGGKIDIHSEYGKGTELIFAIPNISQIQVKLAQKKKTQDGKSGY